MKSVYSAVRTGSLNKAVCASSLSYYIDYWIKSIKAEEYGVCKYLRCGEHNCWPSQFQNLNFISDFLNIKKIPRVGTSECLLSAQLNGRFFFTTSLFANAKQKRVNSEVSKCSSRPSVRPSRSLSLKFLMRAEKGKFSVTTCSKERWEKLPAFLFARRTDRPQQYSF